MDVNAESNIGESILIFTSIFSVNVYTEMLKSEQFQGSFMLASFILKRTQFSLHFLLINP